MWNDYDYNMGQDFDFDSMQQQMMQQHMQQMMMEQMMNQQMMNQQYTNPQIGFNDPYQAQYAMEHYRGPKENYYFTADENLLLNLGFTSEEIDILKRVVDYYGMVSTTKLTTPPFVVPNHTMVSRIMYAYNICMGKKNVDTTDPLSISQHFKKLAQISGQYNTFNCLYIPHRVINIVPRVAVVANIPRGNFFVLNSKLYDKMEATYKVEKIAQEWVTIYSERRMAVSKEDRLNNSYTNREWGIPDILKVEEVGSFAENKPWRIKIHKSHCRLCNRFLIVVTTRKMTPGVTEHHGCYQLITDCGQILYVYAKTTDFDSYGNPKDTVPTSTKDTMIMDYGFYRDEVNNKLMSALNKVASTYKIVYSTRIEGDIPYREIPQYDGMTNLRSTGITDDIIEDTEYNGEFSEETVIEDDKNFDV